jgi:DNA-damage-inducible protein J
MTAQITFKVDSSLKNSVESILDELGISMADVLRIFLKKVQNERGIPFKIKCGSKPNAETINAINSEDETEYKNMKEFWKDVETSN